MCMSCLRSAFEENDVDRIDITPAMRLAMFRSSELYHDLEQTSGGPLHVVLDDMNIDDDCLHPYFFPDDDNLTLRVVCFDIVFLLRQMTEPERAVVCHIGPDLQPQHRPFLAQLDHVTLVDGVLTPHASETP